MKKFIILLLAFSLHQKANAFDMVFDPTAEIHAMESLVNDAMELDKLREQLTELKNTYDQAVTTYNSISGIRDKIANISPEQMLQLADMYPEIYQDMLQSGYLNSKQIASENVLQSIGDTFVNEDSQDVVDFEDLRNQYALNKSQFERSYQDANEQFGDIQEMLVELRNSPDLKSSIDLSARVQMMQAALTNEHNRLFSLAQLNQNQQNMSDQRIKEGNMVRASSDAVPRFGESPITLY